MQEVEVQNFVSFAVSITRPSNTHIFKNWTSTFFSPSCSSCYKSSLLSGLYLFTAVHLCMYGNRNSQPKPNWESWIGVIAHPGVCPHQPCTADECCAFGANPSGFPVLRLGSWSIFLSSQNGLSSDETKSEDAFQLLKGTRSTTASLQSALSNTLWCTEQDQTSHTNFYSTELLLAHHNIC